jgi:hypothetical protein
VRYPEILRFSPGHDRTSVTIGCTCAPDTAWREPRALSAARAKRLRAKRLRAKSPLGKAFGQSAYGQCRLRADKSADGEILAPGHVNLPSNTTLVLRMCASSPPHLMYAPNDGYPAQISYYQKAYHNCIKN